MKIAVVGSRGQLGTALRSALNEDVVRLDRPEFDMTDATAVEQGLANAKPDVVINAAAYNFVDKAEDEPQAAFAVNALGPRNLALACAQRDIPLVHISSDYVFSGRIDFLGTQADRPMPYRETDTPDPLCAYAISKLAGEHFVRGICERRFVLRTCGLYGPAESEGKGNFVTTMLRLAGERDELSIVADQHCTPTSAADLAGWIAKLIPTEAYGLYHATNAGETTWCDFAREIFRLANVDIAIREITTAEFGAKAARPRYSVLRCEKLRQTVESELRPWQEALAEYVGSL